MYDVVGKEVKEYRGPETNQTFRQYQIQLELEKEPKNLLNCLNVARELASM